MKINSNLFSRCFLGEPAVHVPWLYQSLENFEFLRMIGDFLGGSPLNSHDWALFLSNPLSHASGYHLQTQVQLVFWSDAIKELTTETLKSC